MSAPLHYQFNRHFIAMHGFHNLAVFYNGSDVLLLVVGVELVSAEAVDDVFAPDVFVLLLVLLLAVVVYSELLFSFGCSRSFCHS